MNSIIVIGLLCDETFIRRYNCIRCVYDVKGIAPTITAGCGQGGRNSKDIVMGIGNKRLKMIFEQALGMRLRGGQYPLDGYNRKVLTDGICFTITTRTFGDNNHFLLEVDE